MPWQDYDKLSDEDLKSIFAYLMTLTPVRNAVPNPIPLPVKKR
jgi:mono/diheme cytochrome c family protein